VVFSAYKYLVIIEEGAPGGGESEEG